MSYSNNSLFEKGNKSILGSLLQLKKERLNNNLLKTTN